MTYILDLFYNTLTNHIVIVTLFVSIIFTIIGIHLIKIILPMEKRLKDNAAIGFISANTSVLFAVLAGFVISYMLNNYNRAEEITRIEVNQSNDICRDATRLNKNISTRIQNEIKNYFETVITKEWPAMNAGKNVDNYGEKILTRIRIDLNKYKPQNIDQSFALTDLHKGIENLYNARSERISMNKSALDMDFWITLIIVSLFTIVINFTYGMEHRLHLILAPFVSTIVISLLFVIISMDQPFRGGFSVSSDYFKQALTSLQDENYTLLTKLHKRQINS